MSESLGSSDSPSAAEHGDKDKEDKETKSSKKEGSAKAAGELLLGSDKPAKQREGLWKHGDATEAAPQSSLEKILGIKPTKNEESAKNTAAESAHETDERVPIDALSPGEQRIVAEEHFATSQESLNAEKKATGSDIGELAPEAVAIAFNEALIAGAQQKLEADPSLPPETAIDEASEDLTRVMNANETEPDAAGEAEPEAEESEPAPPNAPETEEDEADATNPPTPPTPPIPPTSPPNPGNTPPPIPPAAVPPVIINGGFPPPSPNVAPQPNAAPDNMGWYPARYPTNWQLEQARRQGENRGLVVGGALGYIIGRRRGRIKTEKRLLPVQEKLKTEVADLQQTLAAKEQKIRNLATEKAAQATQAERQAMVERLKPKAQKRPEQAPLEPFVSKSLESRSTPKKLEKPEKTPFVQPEQTTQQFAAAALESIKKRPERLQQAKKVEKLEVVEKMSHNQLLITSEKVMIDGTSLRTIYESKQITEAGLRRILIEHLGGGDVKDALQQELLVKELTYERDPKLRDALTASYTNSRSVVSGVDAAKATMLDRQASAANPMAKLPNIPLPDGRSAVAGSKKAKSSAEKLVVSGWVALVVVLSIVVVMLLLR
jgi:hypothetical protein